MTNGNEHLRSRSVTSPLEKNNNKTTSSMSNIVGLYPAPPPKPIKNNIGRILFSISVVFVASILLIVIFANTFKVSEPVQKTPNHIAITGKTDRSVTVTDEHSKEDTSASSDREKLAYEINDSIRDKGYKDHIFLGKENTDLTVESDAYSDDQGRQIFLAVTLPGWKEKLCTVGFKTVTLTSGVLSLNYSYPLHC